MFCDKVRLILLQDWWWSTVRSYLIYVFFFFDTAKYFIPYLHNGYVESLIIWCTLDYISVRMSLVSKVVTVDLVYHKL